MNTMKYSIELSVRAKGVQLSALNEEEKEELLEENLEDIYLDFIEGKDYEFYLAKQLLMKDCDRFLLIIKDEEGNVVYQEGNPKKLIDLTCDDDGEPIPEFKFNGVEDGTYLTRIQTIKGCNYSGEFELDEPFDADKLYIIRDTEIDDELMGDDVYPLDKIYYQRGESINLQNDMIELDIEEDMGEQYYKTYVMEVESRHFWTEI